MGSIKVVLAEDHEVVRQGLKTLIEREIDLEVVGEASNGKEAIDLTGEKLPDIVLMDITMPRLNGFEATRRILESFPDVKLLMLTAHDDKDYIFRSLEAGASGYLVKKTAADELIKAIHTVHGGGAYLGSSITKTVVEKIKDQFEDSSKAGLFRDLTGREKEILQLIAEGHSTKEIADLLYISKNTVSTHRKNLMKKLDLHNVAQLTQYAIAKGLIEPGTGKNN
jgi:DNA-binding NarL/FixJ family response regulator